MTGYQSLNDLPLTLSAPLILLAMQLKGVIISFPLACFALLTWEDCWKVRILYVHTQTRRKNNFVYSIQFMAAVKFYLFIGIASWAIFNIIIVQNMKKNQRRPEKSQIKFTNENNEKLTKVHTNGHIAHLAEQ